jgi:hypothetical protein
MCLSEFIDWRYSQSYWYFQLSFCEPFPLYPSLWFNSPPPFPVWISILYTHIQCVRGEYRDLDLRQINTCRKEPLHINFLDDDIMHCLLWVLSFYWGNNQKVGGGTSPLLTDISCFSWPSVQSYQMFRTTAPNTLQGSTDSHEGP